jgi:hypothetical protein
MNVQTGENRPCDSREIVGFGIDTVSQMWQIPANVLGSFAKTALFPHKYLAAGVKTKLAPPGGNRTRPTKRVGGSNG